MGSAGAVLYPEVYDSSTALTNFTSGAIPSNTWTHLVFTWTTGGQLVGYINGVQVNGVAATANPVGAEANFQGTIGTSAWNTGAFPATGTLDEVRVSNIARSANWIATEYNNQSNTAVGAGNFIKSVGAEAPAYPTWWNPGWNYKKTLTLNANMVGASRVPKDNSDLANMPVLLSWTDTDLAAGAQWAGFDVAFVINGQKLNHEMVSFNQGTGTVVAWVQIPAISSSTDTPVDVYYGNPTAPDQENIPGTWSNGFSGVWHLEESGGGPTSIYKDSSSAGNNGTSGTVTITGTPTAVAGKIAGGQSFNGTSNMVTTSWSVNNPQNFTISAWAKTTSVTGQNKLIGFESGQTGTGSGSWDRQIWIGSNGYAYFGCYNAGPNVAASTAAYNDGNWHYLVGVRNNGNNTLYLYVDGAQVGTVANGSAQPYTGWWRLGGYQLGGWVNGNSGYFAGTLDEARVSYTARSADWSKAEYVNQNAPGSNITITGPPTLWTWNAAGVGNWSLGTNWDQGTIPNSGANQVVVGGTGGPQLTQNIAIQQLTIQPGHSVDLNGYKLTVNANGVSNQGTIYFSGGTDQITAMDTTAGTVVYRTTNASIQEFGTTDYNNLTVDTITANLTSNITVAGNLALANNGTLNLNGYTLTVLGDITGTGTIAVGSGTLVAQGNLTVSTLSATAGLIQVAKNFGPTSFTPGNGTVQFINTAWNGGVVGSQSFNNLTIVTPGQDRAIPARDHADSGKLHHHGLACGTGEPAKRLSREPVDHFSDRFLRGLRVCEGQHRQLIDLREQQHERGRQ